MYAIINTKLILADGIEFNGALTFKDGKILDLGPADRVQIPADATLIDAQGKYTAPGFIDIHNHGGPDQPFKAPDADVEAICGFFLRHGQTTVLPTLYCDQTVEEYLHTRDLVVAASGKGAGRIIGGMYIEGPYMSGYGSCQKDIRWTGEILREEYMPLVEGMKGIMKIWAVDPARPGIVEFMKDVKAVDPEAIFATGHSQARFSQVAAVRKYGIKVQTHYNDSGKAPGFAQGTMGSGSDECTLHEPEMYAELICDQVGVHVDPDLIKMLLKIKGPDRVILITDHSARSGDFTNNEADGIAYGPDLNYDYEGHLSGSHLTMDNAIRNLMRHTGYGLCHAIRMATLNPAKLLGIDDQVGSLEVGKKANLVIMDDAVNVDTVILEGQIAVKQGELMV